MSAADSIKITVYGRGGHGSMPQNTIDPVVLAAMIVVRLQTVVSREIAPGQTAVLTVGSSQAGTTSNVISDHAVLQPTLRTGTETLTAAALAWLAPTQDRNRPGNEACWQSWPNRRCCSRLT